MLASLSNLYLELEIISVDISGLSSCPTLHCLLTTYSTDYCTKRIVHNFDLKRPLLLQTQVFRAKQVNEPCIGLT